MGRIDDEEKSRWILAQRNHTVGLALVLHLGRPGIQDDWRHPTENDGSLSQSKGQVVGIDIRSYEPEEQQRPQGLDRQRSHTVATPDAGHFIQQDAAELVTRTMITWLNR